VSAASGKSSSDTGAFAALQTLKRTRWLTIFTQLSRLKLAASEPTQARANGGVAERRRRGFSRVAQCIGSAAAKAIAQTTRMSNVMGKRASRNECCGVAAFVIVVLTAGLRL